MKPQAAKLMLTSHITFSVGWIGAVAVFLTFAIIGITNTDVAMVRSAYMAMELSGWYVIVPFCMASLVTGIIQAVGTKWGLFKYYWVVVKLFFTLFITAFLLLHMQPIAYLSSIANEEGFINSNEYTLRVQLIADAGAAILVLLFTTGISVYKPWGLIKRNSVQSATQYRLKQKHPFSVYILFTIIVIVVFIILKHLLGGGMANH